MTSTTTQTPVQSVDLPAGKFFVTARVVVTQDSNNEVDCRLPPIQWDPRLRGRMVA